MNALTQSVEQADVNRAYRAVHRAHAAISLSGLALFRGATDEAHTQRLEAQAAAEEAARTLKAMGADPLPNRPAPKSDPFDLSALTSLDTPDTRELLALLQQAQAVAERVDRARGRALPDGTPLLPGESLGTDLAESVSELALRVRRDVEGPKGRE